MSCKSFLKRCKALDDAQADARARAREEERPGSYKNRYVFASRENRELREKVAALEAELEEQKAGRQGPPAGTEPEPEPTEELLEQLGEELGDAAE